MATTETPKHIHHGRNVRRFREMLGLKQEVLAEKLGSDWSQKKVSIIESKDQIDEAVLNEIAGVLNVPAEAIKNFDEEKAVYNIQNNYEGSSNNFGPNYHCSFNPLEKYVEAMEENKKLYESLLQSEREKNALLERMLGEK